MIHLSISLYTLSDIKNPQIYNKRNISGHKQKKDRCKAIAVPGPVRPFALYFAVNRKGNKRNTAVRRKNDFSSELAFSIHKYR